MKFRNIFTEKQLKIVTLFLLLVTASMGWLTNDFGWFAASILIVSVSLIFHGIFEYRAKKYKTKGIVMITASSLFTIFNVIALWV